MKIAVIIPSNNKEQAIGFIESFNSMLNFHRRCDIIIVGNGDFKELKTEYKNVKFIGTQEDYTDKLISFSKLRAIGMEYASKSDYFLFLDDDNRFPLVEDGEFKDSDFYYMRCVEILQNVDDLCTLQADAYREWVGYGDLEEQQTGFFWTGYGLFIKNVGFNYSKASKFVGCCEETLFAYEALNKFGFPYIYYGNPTYRDKSKPADWNQFNNDSYSEKTIQDNIQGYIQTIYQDKKWSYYREIPNTPFPKNLIQKLYERR